MPQYRADFEVKASIVLPLDSSPLQLDSYDGQHKITLRNAKPDEQGHIPSLEVVVVGKCDSIDVADTMLRDILAAHLDVLAFVTRSKFEIRQCLRVLDWEPFQKNRNLITQHIVDGDYPPPPTLHSALVDTANHFIATTPAGYVLRALHHFRMGLLSRRSEEQFLQFWLALEAIGEGAKLPERVPIQCPKCSGPLRCEACQIEPARRPIASEAIRNIMKSISPAEADEVFRRLIAVRNHLFHGRSTASIEQELNKPIDELTDEAALAAWYVIGSQLEDIDVELNFGNRQQFSNLVHSYRPHLGFLHEGDGEHPEDDRIPKPSVTMQIRFGPPES